MAQEKKTSLRILQHKKKTLASRFYVLIGFIAGLIVSTLIFLLWVNNFNGSNLQTSPILDESEKKQMHPSITVHAPWVDEVVTGDHETSLLSEDHHFIHPKDKDLNKFFERPTSNNTPSNGAPTPPACRWSIPSTAWPPTRRAARTRGAPRWTRRS